MQTSNEAATAKSFAPIVESFTAPARARLRAKLESLAPALGADEAAVIFQAADEAIHFNAALKLNRVLLLELHAAKRAGELNAANDAECFAQFVARCQEPAFGEHLDHRYPSLRKRFLHALHAQRAAIEAFAERFASDRDSLASVLGGPPGRLIGLSLGQGDSHAGGQSVARVTVEGGDVIYKPRSLRIDAVLETFLEQILGFDPNRIRVPAVIDCGHHGWARFIRHRYCESERELQIFYRNLGAWLAVLRLLGGTDIHQENLIACGAVPIVIDVESLFSMMPRGKPSSYGNAFDEAVELIRNSVLRSGIIPYRAPALGFFGVDMSAAGGLPGEQPQIHMPTIVDEGTTQARMKIVDIDVTPGQNHPSAKPDVSLYWDQISDGFLELTSKLRALDADGRLRPLLAPFEGCQARDIRRATQAYVEIGRMLWHPASLHDEAKAIDRARDLLTRNAAVMPMAPSAPEEIEGEINDLRFGDVPVFAAPLPRARLDAALADWRAMRLTLEEMTIRSALVATHLNLRDEEKEGRGERKYYARNPHVDRLDARRRKLAADILTRLLELRVEGNDGTVTWITPEIDRTGWRVQPLWTDLYFGLSGIVVTLAGYLHEVECGRADPVNGIERALEGSLAVLKAIEAEEKQELVGGFNGYGAQVWTWLTLHDISGNVDYLRRACFFAEAVERKGFEEDRALDLLGGSSGAILPLIGLAEATGDRRWLDLACQAARYLDSKAMVGAETAHWPPTQYVDPIAGFAHGATGIAWALKRLILAGGGSEAERARWSLLADKGFALQAEKYDGTVGNWFLSKGEERHEAFHNWCYGSVGIGMAAGDLYSRGAGDAHLLTLRRAVAGARGKWGSSHTLCHGDLSLWEFLSRASEWDPVECQSNREEITAQVVSSIEEQGSARSGMTRDAFTPGLMTGLAGAIHGLIRMHPQCPLPSPLLLERLSGAKSVGAGSRCNEAMFEVE